MLHTKYIRGVTSIEAVVGVTIAGVILIYAMNAITEFINSARDVTEKTQALYLAEEGLELVRFARDEDWADISALPLSTTRYLDISTTTVAITTTPEVIDEFTRSFTVENVYRDATTDDIVSSGGVADSDSKYVTVTVSWDSPVQTVTLTSILADLTP